ncbi:MAG TPA: glycosyltransferase family 4 protein [Mesotoga infera]|nr:glycosyltransferase family 4 protein [Mesotoga sp.]HON27682.1 glycosyltransferase family 4 protein [Mesotoga infera]MBP8660780.1 glycosyltransferase family 4 protein [Mesotoga sp.]MDD4039604.1 glycosyltransferase family 4 protein [Mesotoga sp.]MDD4478547.1 glycosyltransferase family 4 protein [Mesotoga sp.]
MRVCVITTVHPPNDIRISKELDTLSKAGYEVIYIAKKGKFENDKITYWPITEYHGRLNRLIKGSREALQKALDANADIYHFHDPELIGVGKKLKRRGKKVVYDIHEEYPSVILSKNWIPRYLRKVVAWLVDSYERRAVHLMDGIVVVVQEQLERFTGKEKFAILPNFPDTQLLESMRNKKKDGEDVRFVYSGSIDVDRSIVEMIEAFVMLRKKYHIRLDLLGPIHDKSLRDYITEKESQTDGLAYRGTLAHNDALEIVSESDVGLMVMHRGRSKEMSSPLKMYEYLGLGLPIIASDFRKWREVLDEKPCALFVDPDSPSDIAEKMEILIKDKKLRNNMRENAIEISSRYSWRSIEERLLTLYRSL